MKYCLFDGGDVVGPFLVEELLTKKGFDGHSLVCPEEHSEEEIFWKEAYLYDEFGFDAPEPVSSEAPVEEEIFPSEMRHTVEQWDSVEDNTDKSPAEEELNTEPSISLAQAEEETAGHVALLQKDPSQTSEEDKIHISSLLLQAGNAQNAEVEPLQTSAEPKEPTTREEVVAQLISSSPNPIEEYFDSVRSGDLGNILGIPDPKTNSDMNLAQVLEKQFEKTDPNTIPIPAEKEEKDPFDSFVRPLPVEPDTLLEMQPSTPDENDVATQINLEQTAAAQKPELDLQDQPPHPLLDEQTSPDLPSMPVDSAELVVPLQEDDPTDNTISTILEGTLKVKGPAPELAEPIKQVPATKQTQAHCALEQGRVITHAEKENSSSKGKWLWLVLGVLFLLTGLALSIYHPKTIKRILPKAISKKPIAAEVMAEPVEAEQTLSVMPEAVASVAKTPEEQAKEIVQQYVLDKNRGTVNSYLTRHYASQGYTASWSAEPLHRNVYVVKYRLAKTRQEPIVYIFQADTAKKKLTGALNNITLDLVGKIN